MQIVQLYLAERLGIGVGIWCQFNLGLSPSSSCFEENVPVLILQARKKREEEEKEREEEEERRKMKEDHSRMLQVGL